MHKCLTWTQDFASDSPSAPPDMFVPGSPTGKTNKKENQTQISNSSTKTERFSYKAPVKGPLIECPGVWCVLPPGDLPYPPAAAFDTGKAVFRQEQHGPASADPRSLHQRRHALPSPTKHLNRELRWILKREK